MFTETLWTPLGEYVVRSSRFPHVLTEIEDGIVMGFDDNWLPFRRAEGSKGWRNIKSGDIAFTPSRYSHDVCCG